MKPRGKTLGIVGVSAEGAALCYTSFVHAAEQELGANTHPAVCIYNSSFSEILAAQSQDDWKGVAQIILNALERLKEAGAEFAIIPANSVHFAIADILEQTPLPLLSLLDVVAEECAHQQYVKVGVLGVGITMSKGLYTAVLAHKGIQSVVPQEQDQVLVNNIIYDEIVPGKVTEDSIRTIVQIIDQFKSEGCQAVVLACTELPLVITSSDSSLPIIDTTRLLARKAVNKSLHSWEPIVD
jgi:aspartate racemase